MNHSLTILLVEDAVRTVGVQFCDQSGTPRGSHYTYKTILQDLKLGDIVVVETSAGNGNPVGYSFAVVAKLEAEVNFDSDIEYKWIVAAFSPDVLTALRNQEKVVVDKVRQLEMQTKRQQVRAALTAQFGPELKKLSLFSPATVKKATKKTKK